MATLFIRSYMTISSMIWSTLEHPGALWSTLEHSGALYFGFNYNSDYDFEKKSDKLDCLVCVLNLICRHMVSMSCKEFSPLPPST